MSNDESDLIPTGTCWCGCGAKTARGSFFVRGHDKTSESAYIAVYHKGSVAQFLKDHGFGPGNSIVQKAVEEAGWQECPRCDYVGAPASVRNHEKKCTAMKES
ncbi:hypothetical protein ACWDBF_21640 [Streptomyces angustmyceticus]